jgi:hypothetical protein
MEVRTLYAPSREKSQFLREHPLYQVGAGQPSVTGHPSVSLMYLKKKFFNVKTVFTKALQNLNAHYAFTTRRRG